MGYFEDDDNLFGFDMDCDGDLDSTDDLLLIEQMDDDDRINKRGIYAEDEDDDDDDYEYGDGDLDDDDYDDELDNDAYFHNRDVYAKKSSEDYGGASKSSSYNKTNSYVSSNSYSSSNSYTSSNNNASSNNEAGMDLFSLIITLFLGAIALGLIVVGFIAMVICPPVGAFIFVAGMAIKEQLF